jgi:gamma-glutamyl:cysteine ligase YbdK (ATP-grasp superfamily)
MTTQLPEDPLKDIITWQTKHKQIKQECRVAEMDTPGTTKDSREALHDTRNATDSVKDWRSFWRDVLEDSGQWIGTKDELTEATKKQQTKAKQKAVDDFLDTICCALEEMNGEEVFDCFFEAVQSQFDYTKKEHDKTSELLDLLAGLK